MAELMDSTTDGVRTGDSGERLPASADRLRPQVLANPAEDIWNVL